MVLCLVVGACCLLVVCCLVWLCAVCCILVVVVGYKVLSLFVVGGVLGFVVCWCILFEACCLLFADKCLLCVLCCFGLLGV